MRMGFFSVRRFGAVIRARNLEFLRDRSSLGWNILFPLILILGFAMALSDEERPEFKVGLVGEIPSGESFFETRYIQFLPGQVLDEAVDKVRRHELDMLFDFTEQPQYWVNDSSQSGYILEQMLVGRGYSKAQVSGAAVKYVDWVVPGVLGVNMMFSCLFGVGYIVVRYRKSGFLKRLNATPTRAVEFLAAQILSRLLLIMALTVVVFIGTNFFLGFRMEGSYWLLLLTASLGATALISMGLVISARVSSEELAGGLLNFVTWPMMVLSDVWFSMEGSHPVMVAISKALPLTHLMQASRAIMLDGAGLQQILPNLVVLASMTVIFLGLGSWFFRWQGD